MLKRPIANVIRAALVVVGLLAAVNSVLTAGSSAGANPNTAANASVVREWALSFTLASIALAAAALLSRGLAMLVVIALLLLTWSNGIGPAWHLLEYYGVISPH
jgi:hypothetical protein